MKRKHDVFFGIAVLLITVMFTVAGCNIAIGSDKNTDPSGGYTDPVDVTTDPIAVTGVSLDKTTGELYMKTTTTLTATVVPANAANKAVTWSTSAPGVATVAGGIVTPVATGEAIITVTTVDGGKTAACTLTVYNPIDIGDQAGLVTIGASPANMGKSYKLTGDIAISAPIGLASGDIPFTGDFDGNGKTITLNITSGLTVSNGSYTGTFAGLFAVVGEMSGNAGIRGTVYDLTVAGAINVSGVTVFAGGVAGVTTPSAAIRNVASSVNVSANGSGDVYAGGIVGASQGVVSNVSATGNVSASGAGNVHAGGILGVSQNAVSIVYAAGNISATASGAESAHAGGIVGTAQGAVSHAYTTGDVTATGNDDVLAGGIAGTGTVNNVYTTGNVSATTGGNTASAYAGGIVGTGAVSYAYATGSISASGTGTGEGVGENKATIGAGGISGASTNKPVRYTVALNSAVGVTGNNYNYCSYRITSTSGGDVVTNGANNYGKGDLTPTGGSYTPPMHTGADKEDGMDVTVTGGPLPTPYTAPSQTWWTGTGFYGADWNTVWQWDTATGLPKLR